LTSKTAEMVKWEVFRMLLKKNRLVLLPVVFLILLLSACPFNPPNKIPLWFLPIGDQTVEET